jgi:CoA:oxalate CoA-transferase
MNAYQATGQNPGRSLDRLVTAGITFRAKDGYVLMAGVRSEERWRALWRLIGRDDLIEDPRFLGRGADGGFYSQNVIPALEGWSQHLPKREVAGKLTEIGFSMGVAQTIADLAHCPHLEARQMFIDTGDALGGQFRSLRTPIRLMGCADFASDTPPRLGEHSQEILCNIGGLTPEELAELEQQGAV